MKKLALLFLLIPSLTFAQDFTPPQFPGGEAALNNFVKSSFKIADNYRSLAANKYVVLSGTVNVEGKMRGIKIIYTQIMTTANNDINNESKRVLELAAEKFTWAPATKDGNKIEAEQKITFVFDGDGNVRAVIGSVLDSKFDKTKMVIVEEDDEQSNDVVTDEEPPVALYNKEEEPEIEEEIDDEPLLVIEEKEEEEEQEVAIFEMVEITADEEEEIVEDEMIEEVYEEEEVYLIADEAIEPEMMTEPEVFEVYSVSEQPQFPGGQKALDSFIYSNIVLPAAAVKAGVSGTLYFEFTVGEDGKVRDLKLLKDGIGNNVSTEGYRVLMLMANTYKWEPAKNGGRSVAMKYRIPININPSDFDKDGKHKDYK